MKVLGDDGPDFTFIVDDVQDLYITIRATSTIYVTYDPQELTDGTLIAKETVVGPYEKFDFTEP